MSSLKVKRKIAKGTGKKFIFVSGMEENTQSTREREEGPHGMGVILLPVSWLPSFCSIQVGVMNR
jgi:hypothetical protein